MAIYAIGDIQGCVVPLQEMLDKIRFEPRRDQLWLSGDLVNRGPHSLETLRLVKRLGDSAVAVLGNHDLNLLAVAAGIRPHRRGDTLQPILRAPDCDELLDWLRHLPLAHFDKRIKAMLVHAGVYPGWRRKETAKLAAEIEQLLRGHDCKQFLKRMYGRSPLRWNPAMKKWQRARFITNVFTRIRYCNRRGNLDFTCAGPPGSQPKRLLPWFEHPNMKFQRWRIVFGHWSSLGFVQRERVIGLDSGCVWGGALTAIRLDGKQAGRSWQLKCGK